MADRSNPVVRRYLERFEHQLSRLPAAERRELVGELESHIAEATHGGRDLAAVLEQLGPVDRLAEAYRVELALNDGTAATSGGWKRYLAVLGIVATTSVPSFVIITVLGAIGLGFTAGGVFAMLAGPLSLMLPDEMIVSSPLPSPLAEMSAVVLGLVLVLLGIGALMLLYGYGRFLVRAMRHLLGRVRPAEA